MKLKELGYLREEIHFKENIVTYFQSCTEILCSTV